MTDIGSRASRRRTRYAWLAASPVAAGAVAAGVLAMFIAMQPAFAAATAPGLGTAASFGVLAGTRVTNVGMTTISGDLGVYPGTAVTGFPPGKLTGTVYTATGPGTVARGAQADLTTAYNNAAGQAPTASIPASIGSAGIDTAQLVPGVYNASSSLEVSGALTLNAGGNPNAVWIFQVPSALFTDPAGASVVLTNDAQACNVFWQVGSSATLNTGATFQGTIMALTSISVKNGDTITGRALARNGAVTLINDTITVPSCMTTTPPTTAPPTTAPPTTAPPTTAPPTTTPPTTAPPTTALPTPPVIIPGPTSTATSPGSTPTSTRPAPRPAPSPAPRPAPAPAPTPVGIPFPVTG
jgi:Ice-binding-like